MVYLLPGSKALWGREAGERNRMALLSDHGSAHGSSWGPCDTGGGSSRGWCDTGRGRSGAGGGRPGAGVTQAGVVLGPV